MLTNGQHASVLTHRMFDYVFCMPILYWLDLVIVKSWREIELQCQRGNGKSELLYSGYSDSYLLAIYHLPNLS